MAEKISELTGEAREKRIAELKAKMKAAAAKAQAAHAAGELVAKSAPAAPAQAAEPAPARAAKPAPAAVAVAAKPAPRPARAEATGPNGAAAPKPAPRPAPKPKAEAEPVAAAPSPAEMNRREFLTYAWGAALGLLTLEAGVAAFLFMYPRFRAGEFGGKFFLDIADVPGPDQPPRGITDGKFWLVTTAEGNPKALYMVCTHLGCLYKWESANGRFECPCHGSKFTREGYFIEGPAPRSLDSFDLTIEDGQIVVDTGRRIMGSPATESPARAVI